MSASATVLEDGTVLSRTDRFFFRMESFLNLAGGMAIFLLVMLATINVLGRWIFSSPISGYVDWVEQAMAFIAFLGIAYTQRQGGHIRMDILIGPYRGWPVAALPYHININREILLTQRPQQHCPLWQYLHISCF